MLSQHGRVVTTPLFTPVARGLLRLGLGPDSVSLIGTLGTVVVAVTLLPQGQFLAGALAIAGFALSDTVDGLMARELEARGVRRSKDFGAFLDSTLDRVADGAIFGALAVWYATGGSSDTLATANLVLALVCLVLGSVVPYARARAEGLGMTATGGIAERADRLVAVLVAIGLTGLGVTHLLMTIVLTALSVASLITVVQRVQQVRRQAADRLIAELELDDFDMELMNTPVPAGVGVGPRRWVALPYPQRRLEAHQQRALRHESLASTWLARRNARRARRAGASRPGRAR